MKYLSYATLLLSLTPVYASQIGIELAVHTSVLSGTTSLGTIYFSVLDGSGALIPVHVTSPFFQASLNCTSGCGNPGVGPYPDFVVFQQNPTVTDFTVDVYALNASVDLTEANFTRTNPGTSATFTALYGDFYPSPTPGSGSWLSGESVTLLSQASPHPAIGTVTMSQVSTGTPEPITGLLAFGGVAAMILRQRARDRSKAGDPKS